VDRDVTIADRTFKAGTLLNTGLDVSAGSLVPLGIQTHISNGKVRAGVTCAACHAAVDKQTGRILEGAPNTDLDTGLILRLLVTQLHGSAKLVSIPPKFSLAIAPTSKQITRKRDYQTQALENAVDAALLAWPPNFDSTGDNRNNPSQNTSSYTHDAWPYGWVEMLQ